jgi:hypothetical protein
MKYCRQRPELSIDEPTSQLGGLGAELWSPKKSDPLVMGHPVPAHSMKVPKSAKGLSNPHFKEGFWFGTQCM